MGYNKKKIADIVDAIDSKRIFLPAIQRKYVWTEEQVTKLMDSIMRGYPFGSFLFWKVKKSTVTNKKYSLYEFIKDFHERDLFQNPKAGQLTVNDPDETIMSALDGQQRLTSLYIALKGTMSHKLPNKRRSTDEAYPQKELYFNLLSENKGDEEDIAYVFKFLTKEEAAENTSTAIWYKVKEILTHPDLPSLTLFIAANGWVTNSLIVKNLTLLFQQIKENELINYFEIESESIDDVLDIFVRVNSGGTVLSKTDLLFSTIVSYWDEGREEIDALLKTINKIGDHYSFSNDFIMRSSLYIMDMAVSLKVESFGKDNVTKIKNNWDLIKDSITDTINLLAELGFNSENIVAVNAILPIIYYRSKHGADAFKNTVKNGHTLHDVKLEIRKFLVIAQIKHIFGQSTNSTLKSLKDELQKHTNKFLFSDLQDLKFVGDSNLKYTVEDLSDWFDIYEKGAFTFMLLSLLYPNFKYGQNKFHQDHMHPHSAFEKDSDLLSLKLPGNESMTDEKMKQWRHQRNTLANLQLLEGGENQSKLKTPFAQWLKDPENKDNVKYLPEGIDYSLDNFDEFLKERKKLMLKKLKEVLL